MTRSTKKTERNKHDPYRKELEAIRASKSWRITKPLRLTSHVIKHFVRADSKTRKSSTKLLGKKLVSFGKASQGMLSGNETNQLIRLSSRAEVSMHDKDWPNAEKMWQEIIDTYGDKTPSGVYVRLSIAQRKLRNFTKAQSAIRRGLELYPDYMPLYIENAEIAMDLGEWTKAAKRWQVVTQRFDSAPSDAWAKLSFCYGQQGKLDAASKYVETGLSKHPDSRDLEAEYARLATKRGDHELALELWEGLVKRLQKDSEANSWARLADARLYISVSKRLLHIDKYQKTIKDYRKKRDLTPPKIVVYTAIVGDYDDVKLPEYLDSKLDYVLFTDQSSSDYGIFSARPIPYFHEDPTRAARYVKTHPHILLNDYDIAIWVDASVLITGDIEKMIDGFIESGLPVGAIPHPDRKSVYDEAAACIRLGKEDPEEVGEQIHHYRSLRFDCDDLIESGFMMFDLSKEIKHFFDIWWAEIDTFTKRDQLSINYALKRSGLEWHPIMKRHQSLRNHPSFVLCPHSQNNRELTAELSSKLDGQIIDPAQRPRYADIKTRATKLSKNISVDVIVCVHNALSDVKKCLGSIAKNKSKTTNLIIIDDGSDSQTADYLKDFTSKNESWVKLVRSETASGYTRAANRGLRASSADLCILLNSDTIVGSNWTEKMSYALLSTPGAGIVGPLSSAASHQSIPNFASTKTQTAINSLPPGVTVEKLNQLCEEWSSDIFPRVPLIHGFCFGVSREVIDVIGYFDEQSFPRGYGEENDYCFRASDAGFGLVVATNTYIYHEKSKSYTDSTRIKLMKDGAARLSELHGKNRIRRAILSIEANPLINRVRQESKKFYRKHETS